MLARFVSREAILTTAPIAFALILSGLISFSYNWKLKTFRDAADHTFRTISGIDGVLIRLQDAETGQRGFIITGSADYLAPFEAGQRDLDDTMARLRSLMADNPAQTERLQRLDSLAQEKLAELSETIAIREKVGFEGARQRVAANVGKRTMDDIRAVTGEVRRAEEILLEERVGNARFAERMMILVAVICVALSILGRVLAHLLRRRVDNSIT
jgi:CHASE3 domain sensor protein